MHHCIRFRFAFIQRFAFVGALVIASAACSAATAPATSTLTPATPTAVAPTAVPTNTPASASPTAPVTAAPTTAASLLSVDLVFSGSISVVARGSAGQCSLEGGFDFGFTATEADYPGLGTQFSITSTLQGGEEDVRLQWEVDASTAYRNLYYTSTPPITIVFSADHHSVEIHGDLAGFHGEGYPQPGPEQLNGTISCPPPATP